MHWIERFCHFMWNNYISSRLCIKFRHPVHVRPVGYGTGILTLTLVLVLTLTLPTLTVTRTHPLWPQFIYATVTSSTRQPVDKLIVYNLPVLVTRRGKPILSTHYMNYLCISTDIPLSWMVIWSCRQAGWNGREWSSWSSGRSRHRVVGWDRCVTPEWPRWIDQLVVGCQSEYDPAACSFGWTAGVYYYLL